MFLTMSRSQKSLCWGWPVSLPGLPPLSFQPGRLGTPFSQRAQASLPQAPPLHPVRLRSEPKLALRKRDLVQHPLLHLSRAPWGRGLFFPKPHHFLQGLHKSKSTACLWGAGASPQLSVHFRGLPQLRQFGHFCQHHGMDTTFGAKQDMRPISVTV